MLAEDIDVAKIDECSWRESWLVWKKRDFVELKLVVPIRLAD